MTPAQRRERPLVGAHVSTAGSLLNGVSKARRIGAEVIQVFATNPRQWRSYPYSEEDLSAFARALAGARLQVYVHTSYLLNLASPDENLRERSIRSLAEAYRFAALCGASALITHVGSHQGRGIETVASQVLDACTAARMAAQLLLAQEAEQGSALAERNLRSFATLPLLLETSAGGANTIGTLRDLRLLLQAAEFPAGMCPDTAHLFAAGWALHTEQGARDLLHLLEEEDLLRTVGAVHLNDCATALGSRHDRHANLWEGKMGREGLEYLLGHPALAATPFILEVPGFDDHGPDRRNVLRARRMRRAALSRR